MFVKLMSTDLEHTIAELQATVRMIDRMIRSLKVLAEREGPQQKRRRRSK